MLFASSSSSSSSPPQMTLYQYNLSSDVVGNIDKQMMKHIYWHNARSHVLNCIASQKMGLFHHTHYSEPPLEKFPRFTNNQVRVGRF